MAGDTRKTLSEAERRGFEVRMSKTRHPMLNRDGAFVTKASSTPGDQRSQRNLIAALRRAGFVWPPRR
ncbi:hypothetical protein [Actinotalea subterranea]|uniref:hypothetical protein n=1 Tax=Actinotalea subterranea TaxID=2607497 RepID=UPI0011EFB6F1|nr:hypothetical protein [Actinotalea subterranea]